LQLDVDAHPLLVGVILQRFVRHRNLCERSGLDEVGDLLDHTTLAGLAHSVGQLGDDDRVLAAAQLLDVRTATHGDATAARAVRVPDAGASHDRSAGREVRPLDVTAQTLDVDLRVVDHRDDPVHDLA